MECINNKYVYKGKDISFLTIMTIRKVVEQIAEKEGKPFEDVYGDFLHSQTYVSMQNTKTLMWSENAEFVVDEYYREIASTARF